MVNKRRMNRGPASYVHTKNGGSTVKQVFPNRELMSSFTVDVGPNRLQTYFQLV